jgi:hypothetical protein
LCCHLVLDSWQSKRQRECHPPMDKTEPSPASTIHQPTIQPPNLSLHTCLRILHITYLPHLYVSTRLHPHRLTRRQTPAIRIILLTPNHRCPTGQYSMPSRAEHAQSTNQLPRCCPYTPHIIWDPLIRTCNKLFSYHATRRHRLRTKLVHYDPSYIVNHILTIP